MTDHIPELDFQVRRKEWSQTRFVEGGAPAALGAGQLRFRVDHFALTANNISYAMSGDMLRYWDFFPAEEGWGRIPAMGYAEVIESRHDGVAEGTRCFGFYPMSRYLVIEPSQVSAGNIVDRAAHREGIAPVYNSYNPVASDANYAPEHEPAVMLMRGLFMTSFLADDFLRENAMHGAKRVIVTSASSKTSIALAHQLHLAGDVEVAGLTSARNADFVKSLGLYDRVDLYEDAEGLADGTKAVIVDMAGDGPLLGRLHRSLGDELRYTCIIGGTHWDAGPRETDLPGPKPEFFFAPGQIQKRSAEWGPAELQRRIGSAWAVFRDDSARWLQVENGRGREALEAAYAEVLEGRSQPARGHVLSLQD